MSGPWVYITGEPGLLTVGFYDPTGRFRPDRDYDTRDAAAARVNFLNGGTVEQWPPDPVAQRLLVLAKQFQGAA